VFSYKLDRFLSLFRKENLIHASSELHSDGGGPFYEKSQYEANRQLLAHFLRRRLWEGKASDESQIGYYAESTIKRKKRKGLPWDRVTLFDTGRFYSSFIVNPSKEALHLHYEDNPYGDTLERYGGPARLLRIRFGSVEEKKEFLDKLLLWLRKK